MSRRMIICLPLLPIMALMLCLQFACAAPDPVVKQQNHAPLIADIAYPKDAVSGEEVQLECVASDADGDALNYTWKSESGQIMGEGKSVLWMPPGKMGTYPIKLTVDDGRGANANKTIEIRVLTNSDGSTTPVIEIGLKLGEAGPVIIGGQRTRIWTTTIIQCSVENAEGGDLVYTWSASGGKIQGKGVQEGTAARVSWVAGGVQSDDTVTVTVRDTGGREARGQVSIHVFCCGN